jgi:hypothetical protein
LSIKAKIFLFFKTPYFSPADVAHLPMAAQDPTGSASTPSAEMMFHPFLLPHTSSSSPSSEEPQSKRGKLDPADKKQPRKGGRDSGKPNPLISQTEKCKVCLEPAAKHIHYGAVTCFSCRYVKSWAVSMGNETSFC